jgi:hypothetical protein
VRKSSLHISVLCFLLVSLVFNQVALNFFHNKHDAHKSYAVRGDGSQFLPHGEHCKVCALDTLFHLYYEAVPELHLHQPRETVVAISILAKVIAPDDFIKGRAPPFSV